MNEVLVGLGIAYIFLAALLLLALIFGQMKWITKLLLIVVSVGLDLIQKIDSHLVMRNHGGLLES